jgi:transposase
MPHVNAALTPRHRLNVARLVVDDGWPISEVAARFQVSWPTVKRWSDRYLAGEPMQDRSSRPKSSPNKTNRSTTKRCVSLRMRLREGPVQLAARLGIAPSTVHRILTSARLNRLSHIDRATGEPIRRYEHPHPGSLIHVDVKKVRNIPDGGGWRYVGRPQGQKNRAVTPSKPRNKWHGPKMGYAFVHTVIDDHSRIAYAEITTTRPPPPLPASCTAPSSGLPIAASPSSECSRTMAAPTGLTCGETPAKNSPSSRSGPARTARKPTARSSASTAPWPTDGPTPAAIGQNSSAARRWKPGCITTTTTGRTLPAPTSRPSHD